MKCDRLVFAAYAIWTGLAAGFLFSYLAATSGVADSTGNLIGRDFVNMWAAAKAASAGTLDRIFDNETYRVFLQQLFGIDLPPHNWSYPPHILPMIAPLAAFSYVPALAVWSMAGLAIYLCCSSRTNAGKFEIAALALAPAGLVNLITGQNGFFTAAMMWSGLSLIERRPAMAGIAFGFLTIKPQLGILLPVLLLFERRWTVIGSACATAGLLLAMTALLYGPQVFSGYIEKAIPYQAFVFTKMDGIFMSMMPTAFMNARLIGLDSSAAWLVQLPATIGAIAFLIWLLVKTGDRTLIAAGAIAATFIASPYLFVYDMTVLTPVLIALWSRTDSVAGRLILGLVWALPVSCVLMGLAGIPASFLVLCLFAFWLARQVRNNPKKPILKA